jgi:transcriptional regulator with XRE-family HTH domain
MPDDEEPRSGLGRRLGWLRSQRGLTQHDVARRLGLTQPAVSRIESGERRLSAALLIRWAEILDIDLAILAGAGGAHEAGRAGAAVADRSTRCCARRCAAIHRHGALAGPAHIAAEKRVIPTIGPPATFCPAPRAEPGCQCRRRGRRDSKRRGHVRVRVTGALPVERRG